MRATRPFTLLPPLVLAVFVVSACAAPPGASDGPPAIEPAEATATNNGVAVTLDVDRATVPAGGDVVATVTVRNTAPGVVTWQGGGCELEGQFAVTPPMTMAAPPIGHVWDGDKNLIKQIALPDAYALRGPVPPQFAHVDVAFGCPADLAYNELKPGETAQATIVWVATTAAASPAPDGDYEVSVAFPYIGRDIGNPILDFTTIPAVTPITARLVVKVVDQPPVPSASDALDAILADAAFTSWLSEHRRDSWDGVAIRFVDGAWTVQVRYAPERMLSARRDPATGAVSLRVGSAPTFRPPPNPQP